MQDNYLHDVPVILTLSFLVCSICSCGAVFLSFVVKKSSLSDTASRLLFCLSVSDLIGAVVWFLDILLPGMLCPYSGMFNLWGYQSAQFLTCVIGAYLIITCSAKVPPREIIFYLIAYGIPSLVQVIMLCLHLYKVHPEPQGCWVQYGSIVVAFVTFPQITCAVLNLIFLSTIVYKMRISAKRWGLQSRDRGLFFVMICFLLTTVSAILESIPHAPPAIYTIAVCFGALQGFFNSIAMKQKAILHFFIKIKLCFIPSSQSDSSFRNFSTNNNNNSSTWLLVDASSPPSYSSKSISFQSSRSSSSSSPNRPSTSTPHPAMSNSYKNYYHKNLGRSLGISHVNNNNNDMASLVNFSSSQNSSSSQDSSTTTSPLPSPLLTSQNTPPPLTFAPAPLSPEKNSPSIN